MVFFVRITVNQSHLRPICKSTKFNPKIQRTIYSINFQRLRLHVLNFIRTVVRQYKATRMILVFSPIQMLPYFRSMEAFFNLSLPTDWQSLSDRQLQYFFTQLSHDLPMEEILTLCLFK